MTAVHHRYATARGHRIFYGAGVPASVGDLIRDFPGRVPAAR